MKKILCLSLFMAFMFGSVFSANLVDVYKKGKVRLVPVVDFGSGVDWNKIFPSIKMLLVSPQRNLAVAPDGTSFVTAYTPLENPESVLRYIYKFDSDGRFLKKFGEKTRRIYDAKSICGWPEFSCILDGRYLVVAEYDRICLYDLEGNDLKVIKMMRPAYGCEALKDGWVALTHTTLLRDSSVKRWIVLKNVETEKERVVADSLSNELKTRIFFKDKNGRTISFSHPFSGSQAFIGRTSDAALLSGFWRKPTLNIFNRDGKKIKEIPLNIKPFAIDEKVKSEIYDSVSKALKKFDLPSESLNMIEQNKSFFPRYMPFYYNFLVDSEGNILVFPYPAEGAARIFKVYSPSGDLICESQFDMGEHEISFKPNAKSAVFHNGYLYAVTEKKGSLKARLMKFSLEPAK